MYAYCMPVNIRQTIPDAWAERARCPLCGAARMRVQHPASGADQLRCMACGLAFELEMEGARLHVACWPDALPFLNIMVPDGWRSAAELRSLVKQMTSASETATPPAAPVPAQPASPPAKAEAAPAASNPDGEESPPPTAPNSTPPALPNFAPPALDASAIGIRIKKLQALGNSPNEIRTVLTQAEKDPERIRAILATIARIEHQEQARQSTKLVWALGILMVVVILLVGAGIIFKDRLLNQVQPVASGPTLAPTQAVNQAVKLLNLNTPVVKVGAVPPGASSARASTCPRTAQDAANLFGGKPADWYYPPSSNGWVMAKAGGTSASVFVPKGMKAAYLQLSNRLNLIEVNGPATLSDAYYVAISCP
jgi:hypothetical protein